MCVDFNIPGVIYHIANQVETKVDIKDVRLGSEIRTAKKNEKKKSFHTGKKTPAVVSGLMVV